MPQDRAGHLEVMEVNALDSIQWPARCTFGPLSPLQTEQRPANNTAGHIMADCGGLLPRHEIGLVTETVSGCVPGQSAPLRRSKRQHLKFQRGIGRRQGDALRRGLHHCVI